VTAAGTVGRSTVRAITTARSSPRCFLGFPKRETVQVWGIRRCDPRHLFAGLSGAERGQDFRPVARQRIKQVLWWRAVRLDRQGLPAVHNARLRRVVSATGLRDGRLLRMRARAFSAVARCTVSFPP
jgi:hypothetical protein